MLSRLRPWWNPFAEKHFGPIGKWLTPNQLSVINLLVSMIAGWYIYIEQYQLAAVLVLLSGLIDCMDGAVARAHGLTSGFGAILDMTLDRLGEGAILFALSFKNPLAVLVLILSFTMSSMRAKEPRIKSGFAERAERLGILALLLFTEQIHYGLLLMTIMVGYTLLDRLNSANKLNYEKNK
ncbi:MAG: CDP-alcohol phosphatidyltransferase family protein [Candidatus Altiarchaeota archaeon]|nr:CDP-alcohol phosphatidyltransferase family protein [Candidatus Altiarchaeota archaeon]